MEKIEKHECSISGNQQFDPGSLGPMGKIKRLKVKHSVLGKESENQTNLWIEHWGQRSSKIIKDHQRSRSSPST